MTGTLMKEKVREDQHVLVRYTKACSDSYQGKKEQGVCQTTARPHPATTPDWELSSTARMVHQPDHTCLHSRSGLAVIFHQPHTVSCILENQG